MESLDVDRTEKGDSVSESAQRANFSHSSSGGLSRISNGELPAPLIRSSSLDLIPSCIIRLNSSTWFLRGSFLGRRVDHDRRGTGIAVASNMDATDRGNGRSFADDEDEDRRDEVAALDVVRERGSR